MRFSIIIPVYNVEKYIRKCMDSIMNQTFRDFEVIVVDDESPDNSMRIVEEFAKKYPGMIKMFHQKNTRQGGARNHGVREASGEYLMFVDSDDYVSADMLEYVDARLRECPCDILSFQYEMVTPEGKRLGKGGLGPLRPGIYYPKKDNQILHLPAGPVHKAYRRDFYLESNVMFPEKVLYEDAVVRILFAKAASVLICDKSLYYYVQSSNSSIRQKPSERMLDILKVTDLVLQRFHEEGLYDNFREPLETSLLYGIAYILDRINEADPKSELQLVLADYIERKFPDFRDNSSMDDRFRKSVECILSRDFVKYHYEFLLVSKFKEWLLRWQVISWLNKVRRGF